MCFTSLAPLAYLGSILASTGFKTGPHSKRLLNKPSMKLTTKKIKEGGLENKLFALYVFCNFSDLGCHEN